MDSVLLLALTAKASRVFAKEGQFLCFPALSAFSFRPEALSFATQPEGADDWRAYSEFSRAVNHVARGALYDPADPTFLWDVVDEVLRRGECAGRQRSFTPEEEAEHQAALALLYADPASGARRPSAAAELYGQYRDVLYTAEEDFRNRELSAEHSEDEAVRARWRNVEAPSLRQQLDQLRADWEEKGRKSAIESARACLSVHDAAEVATTWEAWRAGFNRDLDMPTDVLLNRFAGTAFTPADIVGDANWPELTLEHDELLALAAEADPELRQRLGGEGLAADVDRIEFECRSAGLDRPWLPKDLFSARFWRLPPGEEPLSDGGDPPKGRLPAYAVGVVFARNLQVFRRPVPGDGRRRLLHFAAGDLFKLAQAKPLSSRVLEGGAPRARGADFSPAVLRRARGIGHPVVRDHRHPGGARPPPATPPAQPAPPPPEPVAEPVDPNITILALICRRLPKSPDPDPSLPWPS